MPRPISSSGSWWEGPVGSAFWKVGVYSFIQRVEIVGLLLFRCLLWSWVFFPTLVVIIIDMFIDVHSNHCTCDRWWLFSLQLLRSFLFWEGLISSDLCSPWQIYVASELGITFKLPLFWISLNLPETIPKSCSWAILMCIFLLIWDNVKPTISTFHIYNASRFDEHISLPSCLLEVLLPRIESTLASGASSDWSHHWSVSRMPVWRPSNFSAVWGWLVVYPSHLQGDFLNI